MELIWAVREDSLVSKLIVVLRVVFEVNIQLFGTPKEQRTRSLLLFVIRDFLGTTPLQNLENTIRDDLERIWCSIADAKGLALDSYFDLQFVGLPHKILQQDAFKNEVHRLRLRFEDQDQVDYLLSSAYRQTVPADGFSSYAERLWEVIEANKDLDLPTQQVLLAQYRCEEIASDVLANLATAIKQIEKEVISRADKFLGQLLNNLHDEAQSHFDVHAGKYHPEPYHKRRQELASEMRTLLGAIYHDSLRITIDRIMLSFAESLKIIMVSKPDDFMQLGMSMKRDNLLGFQQTALSINLNEDPFSCDVLVQELDSSMSSEFRRVQSKMFESRREQLRLDVSRSIKGIVIEEFAIFDSKILDRVVNALSLTASQHTKHFHVLLTRYEIPDDEAPVQISNFEHQLTCVIRECLEVELNPRNLLNRLRDDFETKFRFDESGVPRIWTKHTELENVYKSSQSHSLRILSALGEHTPSTEPASHFDQLPSEKDPEMRSSIEYATKLCSFPRLTNVQQADIERKARNMFASIYLDAQRNLVSSSANIPIAFYVLLLVLGWNELMALLRNPLYFFTLGMAGLISLSIYKLDLGGPTFAMLRIVYESIITVSKDYLRQALSVPEQLGAGTPHAIELQNINQE